MCTIKLFNYLRSFLFHYTNLSNQGSLIKSMTTSEFLTFPFFTYKKKLEFCRLPYLFFKSEIVSLKLSELKVKSLMQT